MSTRGDLLEEKEEKLHQELKAVVGELQEIGTKLTFDGSALLNAAVSIGQINEGAVCEVLPRFSKGQSAEPTETPAVIGPEMIRDKSHSLRIIQKDLGRVRKELEKIRKTRNEVTLV